MTTVSFGSNPSNKHVTTYFRHEFFANDIENFAGLEMRLMRDDGAIVYLNGVEIFRDNMPSGSVSFNQYAASTVWNENEVLSVPLYTSSLKEGRNVLAVEVHQADASSSDIAFDLGLRGTIVMASEATTLVPLDADWHYLDDGSDLGNGWRSAEFEDAQWQTGKAQLGYGDGDEATVIGFGNDSDNKHITTYFRHSFDVTNSEGYSGLNLHLVRDDGAIVYLNGVEVVRSNMPGGLINYATLAITPTTRTP